MTKKKLRKLLERERHAHTILRQRCDETYVKITTDNGPSLVSITALDMIDAATRERDAGRGPLDLLGPTMGGGFRIHVHAPMHAYIKFARATMVAETGRDPYPFSPLSILRHVHSFDEALPDGRKSCKCGTTYYQPGT